LVVIAADSSGPGSDALAQGEFQGGDLLGDVGGSCISFLLCSHRGQRSAQLGPAAHVGYGHRRAGVDKRRRRPITCGDDMTGPAEGISGLHETRDAAHFITMNWRGRPLTSYRVMVQLIANTTTKKGLKVKADLDQGYYPTGVKISNKELAAVPLTAHEFHGTWNYTVHSAPLK
jgi:hypothetical protein